MDREVAPDAVGVGARVTPGLLTDGIRGRTVDAMGVGRAWGALVIVALSACSLADDAARNADDVVRVLDDVARAGDDVVRAADDVARAGDDVARNVPRAGGGATAGGLGDDVARQGDDVARSGGQIGRATQSQACTLVLGQAWRSIVEANPELTSFEEIRAGMSFAIQSSFPSMPRTQADDLADQAARQIAGRGGPVGYAGERVISAMCGG